MENFVKCPSDGDELEPFDAMPDSLFCNGCGVIWERTGNGRLRPMDNRERPDDVRTDGELARAVLDDAD